MNKERLEKRICFRFRIPGATVKYKKEKAFLKKSGVFSEYAPVIDISRGGVRFLAQELLKFDSIVTVKISIPDESDPLALKGTVRWFSPNPDPRYKYWMGVQFLPYGDKKGQNDPGALAKIITLENKFLDEEMPPETELETK